MNSFLREAAVCLEVKKENRVYNLSLPMGALYSEVEEVFKEFEAHILQMKESALQRAQEEFYSKEKEQQLNKPESEKPQLDKSESQEEQL